MLFVNGTLVKLVNPQRERALSGVRRDGVSPRSIRVRGYYPHPTVDDSRGTLLELGRLAYSKTSAGSAGYIHDRGG